MATPVASPNFGERRGGVAPDLIVIHYTAMGSFDAARRRLCDPASEVSAHYLIAETGEVVGLVPETMRAWHAGAGRWGSVGDVNSRSIGIELSNDGAAPFPLPQMRALEALLAEVITRWRVRPVRVIGHSDMAPGRKTDPGARFDWRGLAKGGYSVWPEAIPGQPLSTFAGDAHAFGYPDCLPAVLLAAFRLRFRPWATGPLDAADAGLAADLARRFPVDAAH